MFSNFPKSLVDAMAQEKLTFHAHTYSVSEETFNKYPKLKETMKILQTDIYEKDGK